MTNNSRTFLIMFYYWKLIGLCPFYLGNKNIINKSKIGIVYNSILIVLYTICIIRIIMLRLTSDLTDGRPVIYLTDLFGLGLEYVLNTIVWIYAVVYQTRLHQLYKALQKTINIAASLGIHEVGEKYLKQVAIVVVTSNAHFFFLMWFEHVSMNWAFKNLEFSSWFIFNTYRCIHINIVIIYSYILKMLGSMFKSINDSLRILPDVKLVRSVHEGMKTTRLSPREVDIQLKELCQLHLDLKDLIKMLNELFSLPILFVFIMHFSQLTVNAYTAVVNISEGWSQFLTLHRPCFIILPNWLILRFLQIFCVINICDSTCREANRKAIVLHELWASRRPKGYRDMLKNSSIQLLQQPVEITLYNSIQLNQQLIHKISGIIVTYLVVMSQLDYKNYV